jgi:hypothetical protein
VVFAVVFAVVFFVTRVAGVLLRDFEDFFDDAFGVIFFATVPTSPSSCRSARQHHARSGRAASVAWVTRWCVMLRSPIL